MPSQVDLLTSAIPQRGWITNLTLVGLWSVWINWNRSVELLGNCPQSSWFQFCFQRLEHLGVVFQLLTNMCPLTLTTNRTLSGHCLMDIYWNCFKSRTKLIVFSYSFSILYVTDSQTNVETGGGSWFGMQKSSVSKVDIVTASDSTNAKECEMVISTKIKLEKLVELQLSTWRSKSMPLASILEHWTDESIQWNLIWSLTSQTDVISVSITFVLIYHLIAMYCSSCLLKRYFSLVTFHVEYSVYEGLGVPRLSMCRHVLLQYLLRFLNGGQVWWSFFRHVLPKILSLDEAVILVQAKPLCMLSIAVDDGISLLRIP